MSAGHVFIDSERLVESLRGSCLHNYSQLAAFGDYGENSFYTTENDTVGTWGRDIGTTAAELVEKFRFEYFRAEGPPVGETYIAEAL